MSNMNQDLQATHKILQFIEASKREGEKILDQIPGVFAVINAKGEILRANALMAEYFEMDLEDLLYKSMGDLFRKEEWEIFQAHMLHVRDASSDSLDFELNITTAALESKTHLWYLSRFKNAKDQLFTVVGKDISELKAAQQNLVEIFSSVPLGILTIDANGVITGQTSTYTEVLLGERDLAMSSIESVLFSKIRELPQVQRDALDSLYSAIGNRELIFSVIKDELPKRIEVEISGDYRWFGLTFQPIVYEGIVAKIMVILQDITQLVRAEILQKNKELLDEAHVARILQIKKMDPETQPIIMEELQGLFIKLDDATEKGEGSQCTRLLHGIKGCARVSGLRQLTELAHASETVILDSERTGEKIDLSMVLAAPREEWREVNRLYKALCGEESKETASSTSNVNSKELRDLFLEYHKLIEGEPRSLKSRYLGREILLTLESYNQHPLSELEPVLLKQAEATAETLGKQVRVVFDWDNAYLDRSSLSALQEALLHLLNNAIDHGVESTADRIDAGKDEVGSIRIEAIDEGGQLTVRCMDDGRGFQIPVIRDAAIRKGLLTLDEAMEKTDDELLEMLFDAGFSSAGQVTEISGRGIGLGAVRSSLQELGGSVAAMMKNSGGEFVLALPSERSRPSNKRQVPLSEVLGILEQEVNRLNHNGYRLTIEMDVRLKSQIAESTLYSEPEALIFSIIQLVTLLSPDKRNKLLISVAGNGMMEVRIDGQLPQLTSAQKYILDACVLYLQQHKGSARFVDGVALARFGYLKI